MTGPFRNVRLYWHRWLNTQDITHHGVRLSTSEDLVPRRIRSLLFKSNYEESEYALTAPLLKHGERVVEIGTGIGFISLLCSLACGADNVFSFEASPELEPVIRANYRLNGLVPNLRMRAVTVDGGPVAFYRDDHILSSSISERAGLGQEIVVESDPLDDVIRDCRPTILIMDVEGAETALLASARLDGVRHIVVETHPHVTGEAPVQDMLASLSEQGFSVVRRDRRNLHLARDA